MKLQLNGNGLLSYNDLVTLADNNVIEGVRPGAINSTSIDLHLNNVILAPRLNWNDIIDYRSREKAGLFEYRMDELGFVLHPGSFILASTVEVFNLPNYISAEYKLKSSMARIGLEHLNAGWADAGWHGSSLTLELCNLLPHQSIRIRPGDAIGQMIFFKHEPVPDHKSYAARGRYNNDKQVSGIKP